MTVETPKGPTVIAARLVWSATLFALALGSLGGAVFYRLDLPLAWMLGAMVVVTIAALARAPVHLPIRLRMVMLAVLGVMLGSSFSPEILDRAGEWVISLACLVPYLLIAIGLCYAYFRAVGGYSPVTAFFSGVPGGLSEMIFLGTAMGGDTRAISLAHAARILLVVSVIPVWFQIAAPYDPVLSAPPDRTHLADLSWQDILILTGCAVVGMFAARRLGLPAAPLLGPMVLSAVVHLAGLTGSVPPVEAVAVAQIVLGTAIGCRFAGTATATVLKAIVLALGALVILLTVAVCFSLGLAFVTGLSFDALLLAYAPGGLAEMTLIALSKNIDPAFVSAHHVVRIALLVTLTPFLVRMVLSDAINTR
ncbi:MAG: AbrB family transcriptional regulator [Pseudomonadota bacterium]